MHRIAVVAVPPLDAFDLSIPGLIFGGVEVDGQPAYDARHSVRTLTPPLPSQDRPEPAAVAVAPAHQLGPRAAGVDRPADGPGRCPQRDGQRRFDAGESPRHRAG